MGLAILTLMGGLLLGALFTTRQLTEKSVDTLNRNQETRQILDLVKDLCQRTRIPSWADQSQIAEETGNNLKVFYLDGKNENPWSLETTESGLKISFENQVRESPNLKELQWKLWEKDNRIIGLEVTIPRGGKIYTLHWPWGAQPL